MGDTPAPPANGPVIASEAKQSSACTAPVLALGCMECSAARYTRDARHQRGLSILEFTLVVMIFSVLIVFAANRITALRVDLERAAVEHVLAGMRSALALEYAELLVQGRRERIAQWAGGNPLQLLEFRRSFETEAGADPGPGDWSYDRERGEVVYRPAHPAALTGDPDAVGRWRVVAPGGDEPSGLQLIAVRPLPGVGRANGGEASDG